MDDHREARHCACGTQLARDNHSEHCATCQRVGEGKALLKPPEVPGDFWEHLPMRDALARRHMGCVIRAFREHPIHGRRVISQGAVAEWSGITQAQVSRIENGASISDLDRLIKWAILLRIPEKYLWFSLPAKESDVKRSSFLQLSSFAAAGVATAGLFPKRPATSLNDRDCALWLAWELWQRNEEALHVTELPLSIARYLDLVDSNGKLADCLNTISTDGQILCDQDGYCSLAHPSFVDFYVAQRLFTDITVGKSKLLATTQTSHSIDLTLQKFVLRHKPGVTLLNEWMSKSANAVLRVNSAGILAKLGKPSLGDAVATKLKTDQDSRQLYLTAVSSRVLTLEWNQAAQFAARIEGTASDLRGDLTPAQLATLSGELKNRCDSGARWCSAVLLGRYQDHGPGGVVRSALHSALQTEPCRENLRVIGTVLAGNNPLSN